MRIATFSARISVTTSLVTRAASPADGAAKLTLTSVASGGSPRTPLPPPVWRMMMRLRRSSTISSGRRSEAGSPGWVA